MRQPLPPDQGQLCTVSLGKHSPVWCKRLAGQQSWSKQWPVWCFELHNTIEASSGLRGASFGLLKGRFMWSVDSFQASKTANLSIQTLCGRRIRHSSLAWPSFESIPGGRSRQTLPEQGPRCLLRDIFRFAGPLAVCPQASCEDAIGWLLHERERDPYKDFLPRILYERGWGGKRQAPTFSLRNQRSETPLVNH